MTVGDLPCNFAGYIYVENATALYRTIRDATDIVLELTDQPYGMRDFAIRDPSGFVLGFAQDMS